MLESTPNPRAASAEHAIRRGASMKLRTVTGTRWPAFCACGCRTRIEPSVTTKVVVDFDARPRRTWLSEHASRLEVDRKGESLTGDL